MKTKKKQSVSKGAKRTIKNLRLFIETCRIYWCIHEIKFLYIESNRYGDYYTFEKTPFSSGLLKLTNKYITDFISHSSGRLTIQLK